MSRILGHLTFANTFSAIALFVALGALVTSGARARADRRIAARKSSGAASESRPAS